VALRQLFLETIYDVTKTFNIAGYTPLIPAVLVSALSTHLALGCSVTLGPFSNACNQGMRQARISTIPWISPWVHWMLWG
jgi:uncharacterized membrane protein (GlpM family)